MVERCFQSTYYLLKSKENIISLRGFIQFKKDCLELVETDFILKFFEFISRLRKEKRLKRPKINIDSIGYDSKGKFKLIDFSLLFQKN